MCGWINGRAPGGAQGGITAAGPAALAINQGTPAKHQTHPFKRSANDLADFLRISLLFVITWVQGDYRRTEISLGGGLWKGY